jgi:hypothetical protein
MPALQLTRHVKLAAKPDFQEVFVKRMRLV